MKFELSTAKNGSPILMPVNHEGERILIHSSYNPETESERFISRQNIGNNKIIILLGLGLGYILEEILKCSGNSAEIIVIEFHKDVFKLYSETRRKIISEKYGEKKISYLIAPDENEMLNCFAEKISFSNMYKIKVIEHQNSVKLSAKFYADALKILNKYNSFTKSNLITTGKFGQEWLNNSILNLKKLHDSFDISLLKKYYRGYPALIVSAGPSLDKNLDTLKNYVDNYIIFCVDTALSALLKKNIFPDFICSIDSQYNNYLLVKGLGYTKIPLITTLIANPNTLEEFANSMKFFFSSKSAVDEYLEKKNAGLQFIKSGGSVATSLFSICRYAGCDPIVFIGQDLAMTDSKTHSTLTAKYEKGAYSLNKFFTYETYFYSENTDSIFIEDINGAMVMTTPILYNFCRWFEIEFQSGGSRYINSTGAGILKKNIEIIDFIEVSQKFCSSKIQKKKKELYNECNFSNRCRIYANIIKSIEDEIKKISGCADDASMLQMIANSELNELISMPAQLELFEYEMTKNNLKQVSEKFRKSFPGTVI